MILPSRESLLPSPYAHAVSKKLQPKSTDCCNEPSDSASEEPLHPLMPQSPYATSLTSQPVRPSFLYFMSALFVFCCRMMFRLIVSSDYQACWGSVTMGGLENMTAPG